MEQKLTIVLSLSSDLMGECPLRSLLTALVRALKHYKGVKICIPTNAIFASVLDGLHKPDGRYDLCHAFPGKTEHSLEIDYHGPTRVSLGMVGSSVKPLTSEIYSIKQIGQQHQQQVLVPQRTTCLLSVHKVYSVRNVASKWS